MGGLKLADGWRVGRELGKVEGREAGRLMKAVLELRICMAWLRAVRRLERS